MNPQMSCCAASLSTDSISYSTLTSAPTIKILQAALLKLPSRFPIMLRIKPSKIEVKINDRDEIDRLHEKRRAQQQEESSISNTAVASSSSVAFLHQHVRTAHLDPSNKANRLGFTKR